MLDFLGLLAEERVEEDNQRDGPLEKRWGWMGGVGHFLLFFSLQEFFSLPLPLQDFFAGGDGGDICLY